MVELGISTFAKTTALEATDRSLQSWWTHSSAAEIELADKVGLMCTDRASSGGLCGIGARDCSAAGAVNTKKICLTSAVKAYLAIDPIRLFQQYATIDALSNGRAEIMAGRGSLTESFHSFGQGTFERLWSSLWWEIGHAPLVNEKTKIDWQGQLDPKHCWKEVLTSSSSGQIAIVGGAGGHVESIWRLLGRAMIV